MKMKNRSNRHGINRPTTMFIIFWDILIDDQVFFSPQVKRRVIISNKHGIYELPNDLENIRKILKIHRIIA